MVNELRELLRETAAGPAYDDGDLGAVLRGGRRRVRTRRLGVAGGATAVVAAGGLLVFTLVSPGTSRFDAAAVPRPEGPVLYLSDSVAGVEGTDFRTLFSHTNDNLEEANGQYFDGVTDDGLLLFRDGPHGPDNTAKLALVDPDSGDKQWLPAQPHGAEQYWPVQLSADRLVLASFESSDPDAMRLTADIYDRGSQSWRSIRWPELPTIDTFGQQVRVGSDGRLYVATPDHLAGPPPGRWPTDASGDADDSDAPGSSYHLWSASLTDPGDVRDEGLTVGSFDFTDSQLVYTDSTNGDAGKVHVRELSSGTEQVFDPHAGSRCNLLDFGVTDEIIVLSQYCGTFGDTRDDRVQILTIAGDPVTTIQGSGIDGWLASSARAGGLVEVTSNQRGAVGTFVYDVARERLVRVGDGVSVYGPHRRTTTTDRIFWATPVNFHHGQTQVLAQWLGGAP